MADRPLKQQWFQVLLALSGQDLHGYAIQRAVMRQTDDQMRLWPAMLYRSLAAMEKAGLIEMAETPIGERDDERRQYYTITKPGRETLRQEAEKMARWAAAVRGSGQA